MGAARLVKEARLGAGLSQRTLAEAAGVPQSTVARIELGRLSPRVNTLERLLRAADQTLSTEPRIGRGVDRTLIESMLRRSPRQRIGLLTAEARFLRALDRARATRGR